MLYISSRQKLTDKVTPVYTTPSPNLKLTLYRDTKTTCVDW